MAPRSALLPGSLLLLLLTTHAESSSAPSSEDQQVLQLVNTYRNQVVGIPALSSNNKAACVGQQLAQKYVGTPCNNATGADTPVEQSPQFSTYPSMLATCNVNIVNVSKGYIAVDCVPVVATSSDAPSIAATNFTKFQTYQEKLNDTTYTSAGVGSDEVWYVLVLATDSPDGNFGFNKNGAMPRQRVQMRVILGVVFCILAVLYGTLTWEG